MTVRVRKLAKELKRTPAQVLGVLHALGFERYRSPEDMIPDTVEAKLRWAVRNGVAPVSVTPERERREVPGEEVPQGPMAAVIQGVVRQVDPRFEKDDLHPRRARPVAAPRPAASVPVAPEPVLDRMAEAERQVIDAERRVLEAERTAIEAERAALEAERRAWDGQQARSNRVPFADVLVRRGLVGADEAERAVRALAESRRIAELLPYLEVSDPDGLLRWLRDVLVLVDGPPPPALASEALVSVAAERAEVPGAAAWARLASQLSERLLLQGARRVVVVGGPIRAHRLLRIGMDARIDLRFRPAATVGAADAEADVQRTDAVALWNVGTDAAADAVYGSGRALVSRIQADGIRAFVEEWSRALGR